MRIGYGNRLLFVSSCLFKDIKRYMHFFKKKTCDGILAHSVLAAAYLNSLIQEYVSPFCTYCSTASLQH